MNERRADSCVIRRTIDIDFKDCHCEPLDTAKDYFLSTYWFSTPHKVTTPETRTRTTRTTRTRTTTTATTTTARQLSSVYFKMVFVRSENPICAPPRLSDVFPTKRRLWNSSNVCLIDDGPFSFFQGRLSSASSFHASLLQAIDDALSLALSVPACAVSSSSTLRFPETRVTVLKS